jgi:hypothetical protein
MNSRWFKIALRSIGTILLVFAAVRFAFDVFLSFHTEKHAAPNGGFTIDHTFAINHVSMIMALLGLLFCASSFLASGKRI